MHVPDTSVFSLPIQRYDPTVGQSTVRNRRNIRVRVLMGFSAY